MQYWFGSPALPDYRAVVMVRPTDTSRKSSDHAPRSAFGCRPCTISHRSRLIFPRRWVIFTFGLLVSSFATPLEVAAQAGGDGFLFEPPAVTLSVRGGYATARAGSDIFAWVTDTLTLDKDDFESFTVGGDLGVRVTERFDVVLGGSYSRSGARSEYVDLEAINESDPEGPGLPIEQDTRLTRVPLTASLRFYPAGRGRTIGRFAWVPSTWAPYVGAGAGGMYHSFKQEGSFVVENLEIVDGAKLESSGWSALGQAFAGIERSLGRQAAFTAEVRYLWSSADLGFDFSGFEPIDLAGWQMTAGVSFRL